jgi:hypothetical protein
MTDHRHEDALLDARVRRGLQSLPVPDDARTLDALGSVTSTRSATSRNPWLLTAAAALVVAALVVVPLLLGGQLGSSEPAPAPAPEPELTGTWSRTVPVASDEDWVGTWTLGFDQGGVLRIEPPAPVDAVDGAAYAVDGTQVRLDAFVNGVCDSLPPGVYIWSRAGATLRLTAVEDECAARIEVFEGSWADEGEARP